MGDLAGARRHLEHALALPAAGDGVTHARGLPRLAVYLAWAHWYSGFADQARQHADSAVRLANAADSPHSTVFALGYASWIHFLCGDVTQALELARRQAVLSSEHGITYWRVLAEFTQGRGQTRQGDALAGIAAMRTAIDAMRGIGGKVGLPYLLCLLAEVQTAAGRSADARTTLDEVQSLAGNGNALYAAEALRLEGELALPHPTGAASAAAAADAERSFDAAIGLARSQGARAFELRATMSLARLWVGGPRRAEAAALLSACVAGFSEGFGTEDLRAARRLLADLEHRADTAA